MDGVSTEDIEQMQSRVMQFWFKTIPKAQRVAVPNCATCLAKWIYGTAAVADSVVALRPPLCAYGASRPKPMEASAEPSSEDIAGWREVIQSARVPSDVAEQLRRDALGLGAVDVRELVATDWTSLESWSALRPLEQRRLLQVVNGS